MDRAVSLWSSGRGIERAFADVFDLMDHCRFRDCKHGEEPDCAVSAAVADGRLDPKRLDSMQRLVAVGGSCLLIGLCYWVVWQPIANRIAERERQVLSQQQTLAWLKEKGEEVLAMQGGQGRQLDTSGTLEGVVNRTAFNRRSRLPACSPRVRSCRCGSTRWRSMTC